MGRNTKWNTTVFEIQEMTDSTDSRDNKNIFSKNILG